MGLSRTPVGGEAGRPPAANGQQQQGPGQQPPPYDQHQQHQSHQPTADDPNHTHQQHQQGDQNGTQTGSSFDPTAPPPPEDDQDSTQSGHQEGTPFQPPSSTTQSSIWKDKIKNSAQQKEQARRRLDEQLAEAARQEELERRQAQAEQLHREQLERRKAQEEFERQQRHKEQEAEKERRRLERLEHQERLQAAKAKADADARQKFDQAMKSQDNMLVYQFMRNAAEALNESSSVASESDTDWDDLYEGEVEDEDDNVFDIGNEDQYVAKDPKTFDAHARHVLQRMRDNRQVKPVFSRLNEETSTVLQQIIDTSRQLDEDDKNRLSFMVQSSTLPRTDKAHPSTLMYTKRVGKVFIPVIAIPALPNLDIHHPDTPSMIEEYYRPYVEPVKKDRIKLNMDKMDAARLRLLLYGSMLGMEMAKDRPAVRMALIYYYMAEIIHAAMMEVVFTMAVYETLQTQGKHLREEHEYRLSLYKDLAPRWQKAIKYMKTSMMKIPAAGTQVTFQKNFEYIPIYQIPSSIETSKRYANTYSISGKGVQDDARVIYAHRLLQQRKTSDWLVSRFRKLVKKKFTNTQADFLLRREAAMDRAAHVSNKRLLKMVGVKQRYSRYTLIEPVTEWLHRQDYHRLIRMNMINEIKDEIFLAITYSLDYRLAVANTFVKTLTPQSREASEDLKVQMLMVAQYYSLEDCSTEEIRRQDRRETMECALRWANTGMILRQWDNITMEQRERIQRGDPVETISSYQNRANTIGYNALIHGKPPAASELTIPSYEEGRQLFNDWSFNWEEPMRHMTTPATARMTTPERPRRGAAGHLTTPMNPTTSTAGAARGVAGLTLNPRTTRFDFSPIPLDDGNPFQQTGGNNIPRDTQRSARDQIHEANDNFSSRRTIPVSATGQLPPTQGEHVHRQGDQRNPNLDRFTEEPMLPHQRRVYVGHTENTGWEAKPLPQPSEDDPPHVWDRWSFQQYLKKDISDDIPVPKFNGDVSKFINFWETFTAVVDHNPHLEPIVKFIRLKKALGDEPTKKIAFLDTTAANYVEAKKIIVEFYGRIDEIYKTWESKFIGSPSVTRDSTYAEMETFYGKVRRLISSTKTFCPEKFLDRRLIDTVESKIDRRRFMAWRKFLKSFWREVCYSEEVYNENTHKCLLRFLKDECEDIREAEKYNDSSRAARAAAVENPKKFKTLVASARNVTTMMVSSFKGKRDNKTREPKDRQPNRKPRFPSLPIPKKQSPRIGKCLFCKTTHDLSICKLTTVDQRIAILEKEGRCKVCFKQHPLTACPSKKTCEKCGMKNHHTAIHKDLASKQKPQHKQKK